MTEWVLEINENNVLPLLLTTHQILYTELHRYNVDYRIMLYHGNV